MDRIEAYKLLTEAMQKAADQVRSGELPASDAKLKSRTTAATGTDYQLELKVQRLSGQRLAIEGTIHDNSPVRFSLLEERLEFNLDCNAD